MKFIDFAKLVAGEMVEVHVGLGYGKRNSVAVGVMDEGFVRILGPEDITCERDEVLKDERERVLELWKNGVEEGVGVKGRYLVKEKALNRRKP